MTSIVILHANYPAFSRLSFANVCNWAKRLNAQIQMWLLQNVFNSQLTTSKCSHVKYTKLWTHSFSHITDTYTYTHSLVYAHSTNKEGTCIFSCYFSLSHTHTHDMRTDWRLTNYLVSHMLNPFFPLSNCCPFDCVYVVRAAVFAPNCNFGYSLQHRTFMSYFKLFSSLFGILVYFISIWFSFSFNFA